MPSSKPLPDLTGAILEGRLRLLECLGSGSWGTVYRALDLFSPIDKPAYLAVKCMRKPKNPFENVLQEREFAHHQIVSEHPNVVGFCRTFSDKKYIYVVLDYINGGDLFTTIVHTDHFDKRTDRIKAAFLQLLDAVQHCHRHGVFHRDLKPENVLVAQDMQTFYLADFGLSTLSPLSTDYGCGSYEYQSPQCMAKDFNVNEEYSTRANDIWGLGVILVNMITARSPWQRARLYDPCFKAFLADDKYFLRVLPISIEANDLLRRILAVDPSRRISLPELKREVLALRTFFPEGCEDVHGRPLPIHLDDTSPRTSRMRRSLSSSATSPYDAVPALSCNADSGIGASFIDKIAAAIDRVDLGGDKRETLDLTRITESASRPRLGFTPPSSSSCELSGASLDSDLAVSYVVPHGRSYLSASRTLVDPDAPNPGLLIASSSSSSNPSTSGPITPETHALECDVVVPVMSLDMSISPTDCVLAAEKPVTKSSKIFKRPAWVKDVPKMNSKFLQRLVRRGPKVAAQ